MRRSAYALAIVLMLGVVCSTAMALPATITLGTDPEPPICVINPAGDTTIFWSVQHSTLADYVVYKLFEPGHTILVESQTYPGSTGINITRHWIVPNGALPGAYWVRIEYYAVGIGLEAVAEVVFLVCQPSPPGVCCVGETCYILTELECTHLGGVFYPDLTSCENDPCFVPPPAGCCVDETCYIMSEEDCSASGGIFHPEWTECPSPDPCQIIPTDDTNWGTIKNLYK